MATDPDLDRDGDGDGGVQDAWSQSARRVGHDDPERRGSNTGRAAVPRPAHDVTGRESQRQLVVGISGATGILYGVRLLLLLREAAPSEPSRRPRR